jgi:hypothetical protein
VFDRAHFPTMTIEEAPVSNDVSPFPIFQKRQISEHIETAGVRAQPQEVDSHGNP